MTQSTLDSINITQRGDPGDCLTEVLAEWLKGVRGPPRIWSSIVAVLKEVEETTIAEDIDYRFGANEAPKNLGELKHV